MKRKLFALAAICLASLFVIKSTRGQIPPGYYDSAAGLTGITLKNELHDIISNGFVSVSYSSLHSYYTKTDVKSNGKVWDMYSDIPGGTPPYEFTFGNTCGNYSGEGDCYNREHSVPASWFNDASPMYSDIFHIVPTDGYVNGRRSNYPFGEVDSPTWTSLNGSKLGPNVFPGYTGTVFEPIDSFKGDFARIYFYMMVRYKDEMPSWNSDMLSGDDLSLWAEDLLLTWHILDPVSIKEKNRNDSIYYSVQHNRNPFVDHPEWVSQIWSFNTSVYDNNTICSFLLFPNPATDYVSLAFTKPVKKESHCILYNIIGQAIATFPVKPENSLQTFDLSDFPAGLYYIAFENEMRQVLINK